MTLLTLVWGGSDMINPDATWVFYGLIQSSLLAPCRVNEDATGEMYSTRLPLLLTSGEVPQSLSPYPSVGTADQQDRRDGQDGSAALQGKGCTRDTLPCQGCTRDALLCQGCRDKLESL